MPDSGLQPPYLDPSQYPAYLDLQRKQMLAQALMQGSQQMNQSPGEWNSMRVVPKRSVLSAIAPILAAGLGGKAQKDLMGSQQNYFQGLMGGGASPAPAAPIAAGNSQATGPSPVAPLTPEMPPQAGVQVAPPVTSAAPSGPNPSMLLTGDPRSSQALLTMMGPQEYAKALAGRYAPTDLAKMLEAAGIRQGTPEFQAAMLANVQKQNQPTLVDVREGGAAYNPVTHQVELYNPKVPAGSRPVMGANGQPTGVQPLPGAAAATESNTEAESLGRTLGTPQVLPTAGGGSTVVMPRGMQSGSSVVGRPAPRVAQPSQAPSAPAPQGFEGMPKLPVSGALGAPDAYTEGRLKAAGTKDAELSSQYGKEADLADQKMQYNTDARAVLGNAEVGPSSQWLTENRAKLMEWGVPESLIPASGSVTPTLELNKVLKQSALQGARQIFGSRMTQNEVMLQHEELSPSTSMTRDAINSLLKQDDIKQLYAKQRADDYGKYQASGGDPLRFESWYAKTHPLTTFAKQHAGESPQTPEVPKSPQVTKQIGGKTYYQQNGKWYESGN